MCVAQHPHVEEKQIATESGPGGWGVVARGWWKKRQTNKQYETKKNTHLRRVLCRSSLVLFQAQSAPRPGRLFSACPYSSNFSCSGRIHRSRRRRRRLRGPEGLTRPPSVRDRLCQHLDITWKKKRKEKHYTDEQQMKAHAKVFGD